MLFSEADGFVLACFPLRWRVPRVNATRWLAGEEERRRNSIAVDKTAYGPTFRGIRGQEPWTPPPGPPVAAWGSGVRGQCGARVLGLDGTRAQGVVGVSRQWGPLGGESASTVGGRVIPHPPGQGTQACPSHIYCGTCPALCPGSTPSREFLTSCCIFPDPRRKRSLRRGLSNPRAEAQTACSHLQGAAGVVRDGGAPFQALRP